jgi:hypothetical protein
MKKLLIAMALSVAVVTPALAANAASTLPKELVGESSLTNTSGSTHRTFNEVCSTYPDCRIKSVGNSDDKVILSMIAHLFLYNKECGGLPAHSRAKLQQFTDGIDQLGMRRALLAEFLRVSADLSDFAGRGDKKGWCDLTQKTYVALVETMT